MAEAICKRCIHHDVCDSYSGFDIVTFFPYNEDCEYFKDKNDVSEVQHGEWVLDTNYTGKHKEIYVCSVCNRYQSKKISGSYRDNPNKMNYMFFCPFCGAKMDGKGEGE